MQKFLKSIGDLSNEWLESQDFREDGTSKDPAFYWKLESIKKFFLTFLFVFFETETEHEWGRGRKRGPESEAGSRLWTISVEPEAKLQLKNHEIMTWAKVGRLTDWATHSLV